MYPDKYIYCLEGVKDVSVSNTSAILPSLENLALRYGITNIYKTCDSIEGLEESLSTLLYEDRNFMDYAILYLVFEGNENRIILDNYYYTLEEIAEFFEGKLTGKIIHFANTMRLDLDEEASQYFLDVTGAKAISGYAKPVPILSTILDNAYFGLYQEYDNVIDVVEILFEKHYALCTTMGFQLYY
ncbi:hypothetical protein SY27_16180 [Flavobacterium sp. 316]|uniref:Barstar (Barnase inhibitor) n=1 Tax=Flavobacterium sediminilitoris TaxID=2024526 RepID=A0ABY4HLH2_9FLAO|nr:MULTISPECIES: DUF6642 family protein [Flavobacterium]KIX20052.1 hypothetical protein SY27_16180 [Flavobacterium sp. 316]UOX33720.1 hypothetical protein LXD69_17010 [Flavobacterium sediminilitoris]